MIHKFIIELTDDCKGYSEDVARLEREYGIEPVDEHDANVRQEFAEKIRSHMTKYCHTRLEQQYCAMEVIDFIGKLLGEKDFSIDVEEEMKKHGAKVRADVIDEILKLPKNTYKTYEHGFIENEEAIFVSDILDLKEQKCLI